MEELQKIRAALAAGISKADLAERSGVARRLLDQVDDPKWNPTIGTLRALANAAAEIAAERIALLKSII